MATDVPAQTAGFGPSSALSTTAQSTATEILELLAAHVVTDEALERRLSVLVAKLQLFRQHADQLGYCYADAPVVHRQLREVVESGLAESLQVLASLGILAARWKGGSGGIGEDAVALFDTFVAAYSRLFALGTQLLSMCVSCLT
jgi:hypothetical protein